MMKLFDNFAPGARIQKGNLVALGTECVGYHVVALKAAVGACRRTRRSLCSRNGEPEFSIAWLAGRFGGRSRAWISVSAQAPLGPRR